MSRLKRAIDLIDRAVGAVDPERALRREVARKQIQILNTGYSHHGASHTKKSLIGWLSSGGDADADIVANIPKLRERSRDLIMGMPIATGAVKTIRTNVVGSGLRLNASIDYEFLGLTSEAADEWEVNTEREFRMWADSKNCDASRTMTFGQLQGLALISALASGDVFATLPLIPRAGSVYDLRINLIEADRVNDPSPKPPGKNIYGGIEIGDYGESIACYIERTHPLAQNRTGQRVWDRVEFYGKETGRSNVLHITQDWERPGQRRGAPLLSPVIETLKQLGRYTDAELMAAVIAGMFTVFIRSQTPENPIGEAIPLEQQVDADDPSSIELGPGAIVGLGDGEDITVANPSRQNTAFDQFVTSVCRQVGVALEIPYELLVKHFTASYSASRAALLEAWKMFRMRRVWMVQSFCQPVYEEWLAEAVAKGRIQAPGFFEDPARRAAWCGAKWYGPSQGHLNPLQEATAAKVRIDEEISTREREAAEFSGESWEDIHPVRVREESARRRDKTGPQPETIQTESEEETEDEGGEDE